jgi:BolA protein
VNADERYQLMQDRLQAAFSPTVLEIIDDSAQHAGHAGSKGGAGYYTINLAAVCFSGKSRIEAHRDVYNVLNDLIPHEIHAVQIKIIAS